MTLTPEQLKARKEGIGGSDSPALFDLCNYNSAYDVYVDKIDKEVVEKESTPQQLRGHKIELILRQRYQETTGNEVTTYKDELPFKNPNRPHMIASLDGHIKSLNMLWEAKSHLIYSKISKEYGEDGTDKIPMNELIQVAHYDEVLVEWNLAGIIIDVAFVRDDSGTLESVERFGRYLYTPNRQLGDKISQKVDWIWNSHVTPKIPPAVPSKRKNFIPAESIKIATPEISRVYKEACRIKEVIKRLESKYGEKKEKLEEYLDEYQYLMDKANKQMAVRQIQTVNRKAQEARTETRTVFKLIGGKDD